MTKQKKTPKTSDIILHYSDRYEAMHSEVVLKDLPYKEARNTRAYLQHALDKYFDYCLSEKPWASEYKRRLKVSMKLMGIDTKVKTGRISWFGLSGETESPEMKKYRKEEEAEIIANGEAQWEEDYMQRDN